MSLPFLVWSLPGTAGTALTALLLPLSEHPRTEREPFAWSPRNPGSFWPQITAWTASQDASALDAALAAALSARPVCCHSYEGGKMAFHTALAKAAATAGYRQILMQRRDPAAWLGDRHLRRLGTKPRKPKGGPGKEKGKVTLDPLPIAELVESFRKATKRTRLVRRTLKEAPAAFCQVFYEDLYADTPTLRRQTLDKLFTFLDLDPTVIAANHAAIEAFIAEPAPPSPHRHAPNLAALRQALTPESPSPKPAAADAEDKKAGKTPRLFPTLQRLAKNHALQGPYLEITAGTRDKYVLSGDYFATGECHLIGTPDGPQPPASIRLHAGSFREISGQFGDGQFRTIVANGALARDGQFWQGLAEMKRILAPGGALLAVALGFPGDDEKAPGAKGRNQFRFSSPALKAVILDGMEVQTVQTLATPPRVVGLATKR